MQLPKETTAGCAECRNAWASARIEGKKSLITWNADTMKEEIIVACSQHIQCWGKAQLQKTTWQLQQRTCALGHWSGPKIIRAVHIHNWKGTNNAGLNHHWQDLWEIKERVPKQGQHWPLNGFGRHSASAVLACSPIGFCSSRPSLFASCSWCL